jgi:hypothetical protein
MSSSKNSFNTEMEVKKPELNRNSLLNCYIPAAAAVCGCHSHASSELSP